jgi:hypothetical protein
MNNLKSRLRKAKDIMDKSSKSKERAIFVRMSPEVMEDSERRFREEHPDFQGEIIVYTFGTENLKPYKPGDHNE